MYYFEQHELATYGFTWQDFYLLRLLDGSIQYRMVDLADKLRLKKFQCTRLISKLKKEGFVDRKVNPQDKKSSFIILTHKGKQLISKTKDRHYQLIESSLSSLPKERLDIVFDFVKSLDQLLLPLGIEKLD